MSPGIRPPADLRPCERRRPGPGPPSTRPDTQDRLAAVRNCERQQPWRIVRLISHDLIMTLTCGCGGALGGTRTPNLLIRSQMLYPLSYERRHCSVLHSEPPQCVLEIRA